MFELKNFLKNYYYQYLTKIIYTLPLIILCVTIDWVTKGIVASKFAENDSGMLIKGLLKWQYVINKGSAYGANANNLPLSIFLATVGTLALFIALVFIRGFCAIIGFSFAFAGSFANLFGRIWGHEHGVVDFLIWDLGYNGGSLTNYIFNIADLFVNIGIVILVIYFAVYLLSLLISWRKSKTNPKQYARNLQYHEDKNIAKQNFEINCAKILFQRKEKFRQKLTKIRSAKTELRANLTTLLAIKNTSQPRQEQSDGEK